MKKSLILTLLTINALLITHAESKDSLNLSEMIQPVSDENIFYDEDYYNWGSSIIKGDDGKYHLFYAQMPREHGFGSWLSDGVISRAVADHPAGPYRKVEVVLEGRGPKYWDAYTAHNPKIYQFEGKYYLYYISTNTAGRTLADEEFEEARRKSYLESEFRALIRENQRIGVAVADSLEGPWKRFDEPVVEPAYPIEQITCNPSVTRRPDGGYLMFIRGDQPNQTELVRSQAVALADHPLGPWVIQPQAAVKDLNSEDPEVWYDPHRERYYALYHAFGYMGLITSEDGLDWGRAKHYRVSDKAYSDAEGNRIVVNRFERPFMYMEDGKPKVLTIAIRQMRGDTFSMFIPLD